MLLNLTTIFLLNFFIFCLQPFSSISFAKNAPKRRLKILVYSPSMAYSHAQFMGKIADTLVQAGHVVHLIKYGDPAFCVKNETQFVKNIYWVEPKAENAEKLNFKKMNIHSEAFAGLWATFNFMSHPFKDFVHFSNLICKEFIDNKKLLDRLAKEQFDVGISELYDLCSMGIFHQIGVQTKLVASAVPIFPLVGRRFGIPTFPSFVPNMVANIQPLKSSFYARFANFLNEVYDWWWMDDATVRMQDPMFSRAFGPTFPKLRQIARNASLVFINSSPFLEMPKPSSNKVVYIGGLVDKSGQKEKYLDEKSKRILDNASEGGAVLFTFGSLAETSAMRPEMRRSILRALSRFPSVQFLWKLDNASKAIDAELFSNAQNVHIFEWIRQSAVLKHPNLRAFISHCGQNSLSEAARAGIPVLGIPLLGDQLYNLVVAKHLGMAFYVDVKELNGQRAEEVMVNALEKILYDPKYGEKARKIQKKMSKTPFNAADKLIRWVEFAAEFPELNELNLPGDDEIGWFFYYSLDVIAFSGAMLILMIWIGWKGAKLFARNIFGDLKAEERRRRLAKWKTN